MLITMLKTRRGSADGFTVRCYEAGETYDLPLMLASRFLREQAAFNAEPDLTAAEFRSNLNAAYAAANGNPGLTELLNELSASATRLSKERVVQNPATLLATGAL